MASSLLRFLEHLFGEQIGPFARTFHLLTLIIIVACWVTPFVFTYLREHRRTKKTSWLLMWLCRKCFHYNPPDFVECQQCRTPMSPPWWENILPAFFIETLRHSGKFLLSTYRITGWVIFYGVTLFAFWNLRFYSFAQYPLQELLASGVILLLLITLSFLGRAFNAKLESPTSRITDLVAAGLFSGLLFVTGFLWSAAPFPPDKPLAYVQSFNDGRIRLMSPGGLQTLAEGQPRDGKNTFNVQYAELTWPLFYIDQMFITRLSHEPVLDPLTLLVYDWAAATFQRDEPDRPRLTLLNQTFTVVPGQSYTLREARQGAGLILERQGS